MIEDKQRKEIIASYIECGNYCEVGRKFNLNESTIRSIVKHADNQDIAKKCEEKRRENTEEVLTAMKKRNAKKIQLVDKIFKAMDGKLDNIDMFTNIKDLATAYGIILDKELKMKELDLKAKEIENKKNDSQETLDKLDEVLKNIGGVV